MTFYIVPIVEGHTEAGCIERLLHRTWGMLAVPFRLQVLRPSRGNRNALIDLAKPDLMTKVEEAHAKLARRLREDSSSRGLLLLLLDAEDNCPAELAPKVLATAKNARNDVDIACVLAKRMVENWIMAGASTLAGVNGLPTPLAVRDQFEDRNGAAWLDEQLRSREPTRKYKKTVDAELFVRAMDLQECRANCPSFDKLCWELETQIAQQANASIAGNP